MLIPLLLAGSFMLRANSYSVAARPLPSAPPATTQFTFVFLTPTPQFRSADTPDLPQTAPELDDPASEENELVEDINSERVQRGLSPLSVDPLLTETARAHSREMCSLNYFNHRSPRRAVQTPMSRYVNALHGEGIPIPSYLMVGENLYYNSQFTPGSSVETAHEALMDSATHRDNILEPRYAKVGIGVYHAAGQFWVTEMFLLDTSAP